MNYFSSTDIKKKNYFSVFHYIYNNPGCSKQQVSVALNMSLPTVTQHLTSLLEDQLIAKVGQLKSAVGRKAMSYSIISDARLSLGIEILGNRVSIVALDLYGRKKAKDRFPLLFSRGNAYFEHLSDYVHKFLKNNGIAEEQLLGIGIAIQGLVSNDGKTITYGKILDSTGISIDRFSRYFQVPCHFLHDAVCAATSELWENPDINNAIYISLSRHLGGAVILNKAVFSGMTGKAGTFEHMTLVPDGKTCYCGKKGCAESYCSAKALLPRGMELEDFFTQKAMGNQEYQKRWAEYLDYLAMMIDNLRSVLETPVILGGHIAPHLTDLDISYLKQSLYDLCTFKDSPPEITCGKCRVDGIPIGAALTYINEFLNTLTLD